MESTKNEEEKKKTFLRQTTKAQARRQPISFSKALKIETVLEDNDFIEIQTKEGGRGDKMKKAKNLFPQNIPETLADRNFILIQMITSLFFKKGALTEKLSTR